MARSTSSPPHALILILALVAAAAGGKGLQHVTRSPFDSTFFFCHFICVFQFR
jgi:hypothetical protein